jgi:hypothetical protein
MRGEINLSACSHGDSPKSCTTPFVKIHKEATIPVVTIPYRTVLAHSLCMAIRSSNGLFRRALVWPESFSSDGLSGTAINPKIGDAWILEAKSSHGYLLQSTSSGTSPRREGTSIESAGSTRSDNNNQTWPFPLSRDTLCRTWPGRFAGCADFRLDLKPNRCGHPVLPIPCSLL